MLRKLDDVLTNRKTMLNFVLLRIDIRLGMDICAMAMPM